MEELLRKNEQSPEFQFHVYSPADSEAEKAATCYDFSKFHFIDKFPYGIHGKIKRLLQKIINRIDSNHFHNSYIDRLIVELRKIYTPGMLLVVENGFVYSLPLREAFPDARIILHLHNDWVNPETRYRHSLLRAIDQFWAVSNYIEKRILSCGNTDVKLLYNGVSDRFYEPADQHRLNELRLKLGIHPQLRVILFAGRLCQQKGVQKLVEAYTKLKEENILLLILGGIFYTDNTPNKYVTILYEMCKKSPNPIRFTGYIPYEQIPLYYQLATFCVMPSEFEEPFGMVAVEALACGVPIIATKAGGLPEIITEECGILIDNDDHVTENLIPVMKMLLKEEKLLHEMKIFARKRAQKFTSSVMFTEFCKLLHNACNRDDSVL